MTVTDEDRAKAVELRHRLAAGSRQGVACSCGWFGPGSAYEAHAVDAIAAALTAEREKARAPFLALAESCDRATEVEGISYERSTAYSITATRIRRAAEES